MRDIVERLELQAFVADKIQSGMKPLIMDCLEEITHLRCQYEALHKQGEMNARLLTENASLRAENVQLLLELDMQQATILVPSQKDDQRRIERLDAALKKALDEAAIVRAENEKLRNEVMSDYHEGFEEGIKAERERCARICEDLRHPDGYSSENNIWIDATNDCAKAIRESGE